MGDGIAGGTVAHERTVGGTTAAEIAVGGTVVQATIDGAMVVYLIIRSCANATRVDFKIGIVGGSCPICGTPVGPLL